MKWPDVYLFIRDSFCDNCEGECNVDKYLFCIDQFLYVTELWEISNDNEENIND